MSKEGSGDLRQRYFWLVIAAIGVLGAWLLTGLGVPAFFGEFRLAFGHALLISAILAATVDRYVKHKLVWEITSNVWQYVAGHRVPPELGDYLHDSLQARVIRRDLEITYVLTKKPAGGLHAEIEIAYFIENYGNKDEEFPLYISEEEHKEPTFQEISCISSDPTAIVDPSKVRPKITRPDSGGVVRADAGSVNVKPFHKDLFYKVKFKYKLDNIAESDSDVLSFNGPTIAVTINATVADDISFITPKTRVLVGSTWRYERVFLKEQHIHVRWFPRSSPKDVAQIPAS